MDTIPNGGTVDYTGVLLLRGTTYTASLWWAPVGLTDESQFELVVTSPFRTSVAGSGFWMMPPTSVIVPSPVTDRQANVQVRVWDNQNGTITSWAQALANPTTGGMGYSEILSVFTPSSPTAPDVSLTGLTSFNLTVVPESSALALGLLCATMLWLVRGWFQFKTS